ncbi:MAG: class I SAM-dependent methyltransferase, partial [Caldilinea sp.]
MSTSRALANVLYTAAGALAGFHLAQRALQNLHPAPLPPLFARWLEHPWRLAFLDPVATLDLYGLSAQMVVLELGCGTGLFTCTAAQMVGPTGHVHAVDLQAPLLQQTRQKVAAAGLSE